MCSGGRYAFNWNENFGEPGGIQPVFITDRLELLWKLESRSVGKWATNVKNVQSLGISNTALFTKIIGQKFSVVKHDDWLDPNDWKIWPCKFLISMQKKVCSGTERPADSEFRRIKCSGAIALIGLQQLIKFSRWSMTEWNYTQS